MGLGCLSATDLITKEGNRQTITGYRFLLFGELSKRRSSFRTMQAGIAYGRTAKGKALNEQERLREPSQFPESRSRFWEDYRRFGFAYVLGK
jgi:hypothetical protein